jgi:hypothetical protein
MKDGERLFRITIHYKNPVVGGILVKDDVVVRAAPYFKWLIGKTINFVMKQQDTFSWTIEEVSD